jgi:hypothetical protein
VPAWLLSFLRFGAASSGDSSRLRFDCVEALLPEGVLDLADGKGDDEGALDSGDD